MNRRRVFLAALLCAAFVLLTAVNGWLSHLNGEKESLLDILPIVLVFASFTVVGAAIIAQQPSNRLGWLFGALGLGTMLGNVAQAYGTYAVVTRDGALLLGTHSYWFGTWLWPLSASLILMMPLFFPTGRLPSPRWRFVGFATVAVYTALWAGLALRPGPLGDLADFPSDNPFGVAALNRLPSVVASAPLLLLVGIFVLGVVSLFVRLRRATAEVRQQLKWFASSCAATLFTFFVLQPLLAPLEIEWIGNLIFALGLFWLPAGIGVAILKFRLYDIDVVINRTVVYVLLTGMLVGTYLLSILVLQRVLPIRAESDVAVAASTLAVAALFRPLRGRVQATIDRRFYRRKYDAARTLERFTSRLRDEVELDVLTSDVLAVVHHTVQPARASLWLRATR